MSAEVTQAEKDGAKKYSPIVLSAYDTFVLKWSNTYAWRCPRERLLAHYDTHLGGRHLDIGPGTGWYLHNATYPTAVPEITLMDLNSNTMAMTTGRLAERGITAAVHTGSVLAPIDPGVGVFDSVAEFDNTADDDGVSGPGAVRRGMSGQYVPVLEPAAADDRVAVGDDGCARRGDLRDGACSELDLLR